ncbi:hypothetical protein HK097_009959 [Rhizophlyctis rosea]|uniref:RGS domain-containing protein n=1 Tax=Rhizophlyctis rosea TaxID=64517 RepID=A0AAD5X0S2_9FUNG|nr:hypothetical protein HK097_009959 [Rhizophlyctis rosea]
MEKLITLYLTPGGDREVNLPAVTRKKIVSEVKEKGNYHPDIFATAMEQTYQLMKTSSYPQFYKQAAAAATSAGRPIGERRITAPAASGAAQ